MKHLFLLLFLVITPALNSQNISVKSFRQLPGDLDARVNEPLKDQNGDICAIIKVNTTETGFTFDCGQLGIIKTVQKTAEIWVYIPWGTRRIAISHPKLGMLADREYVFPQSIEKATVYELVLSTGKITTTVEETIESQWLAITTDPPDAAIYINDQFMKSGMYQAKLKTGSYTYRIEAPLYHNEVGKVEITDSKKELNVKLLPAFGYLSVVSTPEQDAKVIIDGTSQTGTTPLQNHKLASGEHTVQVLKEMYQPTIQKVIIADGQTLNVSLAMSPNFAELNITAPPDAELYINSEQKGTGSWQGRINAGIYSVEARRKNYRTAVQDIELAAGDKRTVNLQPVPITGSLDVITTPIGASITINGKDNGTTPNTINKLLIGEYNISLSKQGYVSVDKTVNVTEGINSEINETLVSIKPVIKKTEKAKPEPGNQPAITLNNDYYKYKKSKNFWLLSGLATLSAGTISYLQSERLYSEYNGSTTDAVTLHQKVKTYDTVYPICFVLTGICTVEFIIKAGKQGMSERQTIGLTYYDRGVGVVYNF